MYNEALFIQAKREASCSCILIEWVNAVIRCSIIVTTVAFLTKGGDYLFCVKASTFCLESLLFTE